MHPFPPYSELQFLVGKLITQVCLGCWQVQFRFDKASILVDGELEHVDGEGVTRRHNTDADKLSPIYVHHLIGQTVTLVSVEPFCLTFTFDRGDLLHIYSDNDKYECGQIINETGGYMVF